MAEAARVETARKAFAEVTGALEDATLIAAEGQATPDLAAARQIVRSPDRAAGSLPRATAAIAEAARMTRIACAIYTRKSSEEGLEKEFNSLDAQREACEAYITSQKHAGWVAVRDLYDDGGLSGGTMERPALQAAARRHQVRQGADRGRLQGRPADALAGRFRQDRRRVRCARRLVRLGDAAVQHDDVDGPADAQHAALVRPVRARDRRRAHPRQDRGVEGQGHVDGRHHSARLRRQGPQAGRQRGRGRDGAHDLSSAMPSLAPSPSSRRNSTGTASAASGAREPVAVSPEAGRSRAASCI